MIRNYVCYDIETVKNERAEEYIEKFKEFKAPANFKDPEKIKQNILNQKAKALGQAGLSWITGKVCCISAKSVYGDVFKQSGEDELKLLVSFFTFLEGKGFSHVVGKNSETFDTPFLIGRAMYHDIGLPKIFRGTAMIFDVDKIFGWSSQSGQRGKLSEYAFGLGIGGKLASGSDVQGMYDLATLGNNEQWDFMEKYCMKDTEIVLEIMNRYDKKFGQIGETQ